MTKATYYLATAAALALLATPALAQNVVNGVDRDSPAYKAAYNQAADVGACSGNLFQRTGYQGGAKVAVVPLWDSNKTLAQACVDRADRSAGGRAIEPGPGGLSD